MWKLPMFGCTDPNQVLGEIDACKRAFPECYIRLVAFDKCASHRVAYISSSVRLTIVLRQYIIILTY